MIKYGGVDYNFLLLNITVSLLTGVVIGYCIWGIKLWG